LAVLEREGHKPDHVAAGLADAAAWIVADAASRQPSAFSCQVRSAES
jgi:hypothetical protein